MSVDAKPNMSPVSAPAVPEQVLVNLQTTPEYSDKLWEFKQMDPQHQALFLHYQHSAKPLAKVLAAQIAQKTTISLEEETACKQNLHCMQTKKMLGLTQRPYRIQFYAPQYLASDAMSFIIHHEIGHAISRGLIDGSEMEMMAAYFRQSPHWQECYSWTHPDEGPQCLAMEEIFAEQFAIYATSMPASLSGYQLPKLFEDKQFAQFLAAAGDVSWPSNLG